MAEVSVRGQSGVEVEISLGGARQSRTLSPGEEATLATEPVASGAGSEIVLAARGGGKEAAVRLHRLRYAAGGREVPLPIFLPPLAEVIPPPVLPPLRPAIEQALIEWDWRMQDGIGTDRQRRTWARRSAKSSSAATG